MKIVVTQNTNAGARYVLKNIDDTQKTVIVVPDRFSMLAEEMYFEEKNIQSTFNVDVMGINKLAKQIILDAGLECVYYDSEQSYFSTIAAVAKCKDNFKVLGKNLNEGLCENLFDIISLLKSCDVSISKLKQIAESKQNNLKLNDIILAYENYEDILCGRLDSTNTLKTFCKLIESSLDVKQTSFCFVMFDDMTTLALDIVATLAKYAKSVTISVIEKSGNGNGYIFTNELYEKLKQKCKNLEIGYELEKVESDFVKSKKDIFEHCFSTRLNSDIKSNKLQLDYSGYENVIKAVNMRDEVQFVVKQILSLVKNENVKFNQIAIATSSGYYKLLKDMFLKENINFFVDENIDFSSTPLFDLIETIFDVCLNGFDEESIFSFMCNVYVKNAFEKECYDNLLKTITMQNLQYKKFTECCLVCENLFLKTIVDFVENFKTCKIAKDYLILFKQLLINLNIEQTNNELSETFNESGDLILARLYAQVYKKIVDQVEKMIVVVENIEFSKQQFVAFFVAVLKNISISLALLSVDNVFVGDVCKSFFGDCDYLFVVGANNGNIPVVQKDCSLLLDDEIEKMQNDVFISPTVKLINKQNKFKLFETLLLPNKKLFVTYSSLDENGTQILPSRFVLDMIKMRGGKNFSENQTKVLDYKNNEVLKFNFPSISMIKNCGGNNDVSKQLLSAIGVEFGFDEKCKDETSNSKNIFDVKKTKISQIEKFYKCPFSHFLAYGLKLAETINDELKPLDFGNFLHKFCEIFAKRLKNIENENRVEGVADEIFCEILCDRDFEKLTYKQNQMSKLLLNDEVKRIALFIFNQQKNTMFKIDEKLLEFRFDKNNSIKVNANGEVYEIVGVIDRIDTFNDNFIIMDYKTGSENTSKARREDLYNGVKIQVLVYEYAFSKISGKKAFGGFYMPLSTKYMEENKARYKLGGYFVNDKGLATAMDTSLGEDNLKSKYFECALKKPTAKQSDFALSSQKTVDEVELLNMQKFALQKISLAIEEINCGNTKVSPFESACAFCPFKSICGIDVLENRTRSEKVGVDLKNYFKEVDE